MWSFHGVGEQKFVCNVWVTWPRWQPCLYIVKTFENLLSGWLPWNLICIIRDRFYLVCLNDDPWLTLTYFTASSNSVTLAFVWETGKTVDLCEAIVAHNIQSWCMQSPKGNYITTIGQGHLLIFVLDASGSVYLARCDYVPGELCCHPVIGFGFYLRPRRYLR